MMMIRRKGEEGKKEKSLFRVVFYVALLSVTVPQLLYVQLQCSLHS